MARDDKKRILRERRRWLTEIHSITEFIRGSVVVLRRPCSYKACTRCAKGIRHPGLYHTVSKKGKTQTTYLGASAAPVCRKGVAAYKRLMELIEQVSDLNLILLIATKRRKRS